MLLATPSTSRAQGASVEESQSGQLSRRPPTSNQHSVKFWASVEEVRSGQLSMFPPTPGYDPAKYWAGVAQDQWEEFSIPQRKTALKMGKSLNLLSDEVQRNLALHKVELVATPASLERAPSVKRAASAASNKVQRNSAPGNVDTLVTSVSLGRSASVKRAASAAKDLLNRGIGSLTRKLSQSNKRPQFFRFSQGDKRPQIPGWHNESMYNPTAPLTKIVVPMSAVPLTRSTSQPFGSALTRQSSIVPSLFNVQVRSQPVRHVHYNDTELATHAAEQMQRRATASEDSRRGKIPDLRKSRTMPEHNDTRPAANTNPLRKEDTGLIVIGLHPTLVPEPRNLPVPPAFVANRSAFRPRAALLQVQEVEAEFQLQSSSTSSSLSRADSSVSDWLPQAKDSSSPKLAQRSQNSALIKLPRIMPLNLRSQAEPARAASSKAQAFGAMPKAPRSREAMVKNVVDRFYLSATLA
jgi:hypothetical protein